jgi:hypothetical protein
MWEALENPSVEGSRVALKMSSREASKQDLRIVNLLYFQ